MIEDYDDGSSLKTERWPFNSDAQNIFLMAFKDWVGSGIYSGAGSGYSDLYYPYRSFSDGEESLNNEFLMKEDLTLDGILDATINGDRWFLIGTPNILDESNVTIYDIPMKRYVFSLALDDNEISSYTVVYSFILDKVPYIWKLSLAANSSDVLKMSEDCRKLYLQTTELVADTLIRTIRTSPNEIALDRLIYDNSEDPVNYPFE